MPVASFADTQIQTAPRPTKPRTTRLSVLRRFTTEWPLKAALFGALWIAFGIPYLLLQRFPFLTPHKFPLTPLDRWIGFHPQWVYVYQSAYLLIPISPLLSQTKHQLLLFARSYLLMTGIAILFFSLLPIEAPRPADAPLDGMFGLLLLYDRLINVFPSLHVAMVVQSLAFGAWLSRESTSPAPRIALAAGILWAALICYSTLATKQHYFVDVPAGIALGLFCHWAIARKSAPASAHAIVTSNTRNP